MILMVILLWWVNAIFERSGSTQVKTMKIITMTEGSTILGDLVELRLTKDVRQADAQQWC